MQQRILIADNQWLAILISYTDHLR